MSKKNKQTSSKGGISPVKMKRWGKRLGILAGIAVVGYAFVFVMGVVYPDQPGFYVALQATQHSDNCAVSSYNTLPPTSGCHRSSQAGYGVSSSPIPEDLQIHNLEHGGVIIQYQHTGLDAVSENTIADIEAFVENMRQDDRRYCRLISAPYAGQFKAPNMSASELSDKRIAVTSWGRMMLLEEFDRAKVTDFINAYINQGPEDVADC